MSVYGSLKMNEHPLAKHLEFVQGLNCVISGNLSNSSAQALSVAQLCALANQDSSIVLGQALQYAPLKGDENLRCRIAAFHQRFNNHQVKLTAEHVLTFCGAQEALSAIYKLLLKPGDEVVVLSPNYPSLTDMVYKCGCVVKRINLSAENCWQPSFEDFRSNINSKTKLIVLNSPHNPTGAVIDSTMNDKVLALAQQLNCYIIADDVSQASNYNNLSLAHRFLDYNKAIIVSVMSKSLGLAGLRVGWVVSQNLSLLKNLLSIKSYGSICCSFLDEQLSLLALTHYEKIIDRNNTIIKSNIDRFEEFINQHHSQFSWIPPQAGILALVEYKGMIPIENWAKKVALESGILLLPSRLFGLDANYFRLGLGQNNFKHLIQKLSNHIKS